jgi:hypothetical protein
MHDPLTVCFQIKYPWRGRKSHFFPKGFRDTFITIWHKDPCRDGSDNSCDWFGSKKKLNANEKAMSEAIWHLETILDNRPFYPDHEAHKRFQPVKDAMHAMRQRSKWRIHPRYHVWHWRIQCHPLQKVWVWLFHRCCKCGKGYGWNEQRLGNWHGDKTWHFRCDESKPVPVGTLT